MSTALKQNPERRHVTTEPVFKQRFTVVRSGHQLAEGDPAPATGGDVLTDVVVVQCGEAKGHGVHLEQAFVDKIVELGNASPSGIKARFDHPGRCETEFGWQIGVLRNFRVDGDRAIADLHLSESAKVSPHGDLHAYILAAAQEHPDKFGNSIVFDELERYTYSPEGERVTEDEYYGDWEPDEDEGYASPSEDPYAKPARNWSAKKWYVMPANLYACDVVDEPAATAGFFSRMFSQSWAKPLASLLKLPEVEAFAKQFPKVYKGLYSTPHMKTKQFDINAVTDQGARLIIVGESETIAPGSPVNVVAEDGSASPAPAGEHLIVESDSGEVGTITVDDMGICQDFVPGVAADAPSEEPTAATEDNAATTAEMAALKAEVTELRAFRSTAEARFAALEKQQTTFGNTVKGFFTRLNILEGQPAGKPLPGAGGDARGSAYTSLMDNPWNKEAEAALANL
jgi:hypothetical protein